MAFEFPSDFRFADSHEYAHSDGELVKIGISAFAVDQLGDIVFVDLPEVGTSLTKGNSFGSVESVKAVEEMMTPVTGEVISRNEDVLNSPEAIQNDPHGEGWMLELKPKNLSEMDDLMDSETYSKKVSGN